MREQNETTGPGAAPPDLRHAASQRSTGWAATAAAVPVRDVAPEWTGSPTLDLLDDLIRTSEHTTREMARRSQLSPNELHALRFLTEEDLGPSDLARRLGVTTAASSGVVDRLRDRGHVERRPHPDDRRRTQVVITESGRAEMLGRLAPMFAALAEVDAGLDDAHRAAVERYLRGAIDAMRRVL